MATSESPNRAPDSREETAVQTVADSPPAGVRFTPGTLLAGRYRLVAPLGRGGMGEVYRAEDLRLGQPVALKFLPAALAAEPGRLDRLLDEVRIGRQISHPNVCRLYDIAEADGHHFLVMEYVDGEDLASLLRRIGRLPRDKALEIARGVCAGLAAAHDKGVIHRDLKPANVMIDGLGHARIADFGLAALAGEALADRSGTPAYMAPEQIAGGSASLRSDVFALGLVFYEMVTGRRAFQAQSFAELQALHSDSRPISLSSSGSDLDPAVERVILRCLARDPADRPASASAVLAALPGGDPLQAALLAGETPSPEMVAAAAKVGDLRPSVAWACLLSGLLGLLVVASLGPRAGLYGRVSMRMSPEVLTQRARDLLARLGHATPPLDSAIGFLIGDEQLAYIARSDASPGRWDKLRTARGGPLLLYYRQSPRRLIATSWIPTPPWAGPPELGRVLRRDPPMDVPGMTEVVLDTEGRLASFSAVPPRLDAEPGPFAEPDWSYLIEASGFEAAALRPSAPRWAAPVDSDRKAAWEGVNPDQPDVPMRIEAAAYHGRPVHFEVLGPWVKPPSNAPGESMFYLAGTTGIFIVAVPFWIAGVLMMRRNLRMGRGDRRGALRLALFNGLGILIALAFRADHTGALVPEFALWLLIVSQACYAGIAVWLMYMALEPAVRRRWPHTLISWSRVLVGRFGDPLVARDFLVGALAGIAVNLVSHVSNLMPLWLGQPSPPPTVAVGTTLNASRHILYFLLVAPCLGVVYSLGALFMYYLFHAATQNAWAARAILFLMFFLPSLAQWRGNMLGVAVPLFFSTLAIVVVIRFGLLAAAVLLATFSVLIRSPLTLDASAWYAPRSFTVLLLLAALLVVACHKSLGGKPMFGRALLED